jgi:hypothetical protein
MAIELFIADPKRDARQLAVQSGSLISEIWMGDGRMITVASLPYQIEKPPSVVFAQERIQAMKDMCRLGWDGSPTAMVIFMEPDEFSGFMVQVEIAIALVNDE